MATNKDRLISYLKDHADSHGAVAGTAEEIRRDVMMSRHDFSKYLWDLKATGVLTFTEVRRGTQTHPARIIMRGTQKPSTNGVHHRDSLNDRIAKITAWAADHGGEGGAWVEIGNVYDTSAQMGLSYDMLMQTLRKMIESGTIDVHYRGATPKTGYKAFRVLAWAPPVPKIEDLQMPEGSATPEEIDAFVEAVNPTPVVTPLLDAYQAARDFVRDHPDNPYVQFEASPLAEEALLALGR